MGQLSHACSITIGNSQKVSTLSLFLSFLLLHPKQIKEKKLLTKVQVGTECHWSVTKEFLKRISPFWSDFVFRKFRLIGWFCMTMGRLRHLHFILLLGISLFVPLFLAYSLYVDLSRTVLLPSDMSDDSGDDDSSTSQSELNVFVPPISSTPFLPSAHFRSVSSFFLSSLMPHTQNTPVLRC